MSAAFLSIPHALSHGILTAALRRLFPLYTWDSWDQGGGGLARLGRCCAFGRVCEARASGGPAVTLCSTARQCKFTHEVQSRRCEDSEKYIVSPLSAISLAVVSVDLGPNILNGKFQKYTIHVVNCAPFCVVRWNLTLSQSVLPRTRITPFFQRLCAVDAPHPLVTE